MQQTATTTMEVERHLFNRFTAEDQGMMESPHNTPAKKVRKVEAIQILRDLFGKRLYLFALLRLKVIVHFSLRIAKDTPVYLIVHRPHSTSVFVCFDCFCRIQRRILPFPK
jgi:hypothetical protein